MYRYQQKQWLERQRMQEEEARSRSSSMIKGFDEGRQPEEQKVLQSMYDQTAPAKLLFPTTYHMQQVTYTKNVIIIVLDDFVFLLNIFVFLIRLSEEQIQKLRR